jgi:membrane protease YdiL (CAAX protease family)
MAFRYTHHLRLDMDTAFSRLKARYLLLWFVLTTILAIVVAGAAGLFPPSGPHEADEIRAGAGLAALSSLFLLAASVAYARRTGVGFGSSFGAFPRVTEAVRLSVLAIPLVAGAIVLIYLVFAPLSLVWPNAIQSWLFDYLPTFYSAETPYPFAANLLGLSSLVILGPVTEEWFFRGLLLRRLALKWGSVSGVLVSSVAFGLLHADIIGATIFGIVMCALYARTGSLWAPTIVHAANNAIAGGLIILGAHGWVEPYAMTVEGLRNDWVSPLVGVVVVSPWIPRAWSAWQPMAQWQFGASSRSEPGVGTVIESVAVNR